MLPTGLQEGYFCIVNSCCCSFVYYKPVSFMHILIIGASGSGVTTLGKALEQKTGIPYFDADEYYWEKTDPPFQNRIEAGVRNQQLLSDLHAAGAWIVGGSLDSWGDCWKKEFDKVVFLWLPKQVRAMRLINREKERYGETLSQQSQDFIDWALAYDDNNRHGRNRQRHEGWLQTLACPVLKIEGDMEVRDKTEKIAKWMEEITPHNKSVLH